MRTLRHTNALAAIAVSLALTAAVPAAAQTPAPNWASFQTALNNVAKSIGDVTALTAVDQVVVVPVRPLAVNDERVRADYQITQETSDIEKLRAAIKANAAIDGMLAAKNVDLGTVVAVDVGSGGTLVVYTL